MKKRNDGEPGSKQKSDRGGTGGHTSAKARVIDQKRGEVIVPCASPFAAILCAAEVWKCDWTEIIHAEVWRYDE